VNVITRSGTNQLHGTGFGLFQDEDLRSRSPYANRLLPKDPNQRIQYGATIGGPIRQNKTHFFATYERDDRDTNTAVTYNLPSAAQVANAAASTQQFLLTHNIDISRFGAGGSQRLARPEFVDVHKATAPSISSSIRTSISPCGTCSTRTISRPGRAARCSTTTAGAPTSRRSTSTSITSG
jgi:hypothetical protein